MTDRWFVFHASHMTMHLAFPFHTHPLHPLSHPLTKKTHIKTLINPLALVSINPIVYYAVTKHITMLKAHSTAHTNTNLNTVSYQTTKIACFFALSVERK